MTTINTIRARIAAINIKDESFNAVVETKQDITEIQKEQLLHGLDASGNDIHPTYLEDTYFKTVAAAQRYSDWKDRITPNSRRKKGVPNLFITGVFHDTLETVVKKDVFYQDSKSRIFPDINRKYGSNLLGLNKESKIEYVKELRPVFIKNLRQKLKL